MLPFSSLFLRAHALKFVTIAHPTVHRDVHPLTLSAADAATVAGFFAAMLRQRC